MKGKQRLNFRTHQQYESIATVLFAIELMLIFSDAFSKNGRSPVIPMIAIQDNCEIYTNRKRYERFKIEDKLKKGL